jgi:membrane protein required for colicin V production
MDWVSILIVVFLGLLTWRSYRNGFIREAVSLSAVILAIPIAGLFYDDLFPKVHPIVDNVALANLVSFLSIFAGVIVGGQVASYLLKGTANALNLGSADNVAGGAFGFLKGVIACQVVLIALVAFPRPDFHDDIDRSPVAGVLLDTAPALLAVLPGRFNDAVDTFMSPARQIDERLKDRSPTPTPVR